MLSSLFYHISSLNNTVNLLKLQSSKKEPINCTELVQNKSKLTMKTEFPQQNRKQIGIGNNIQVKCMGCL